MVSLLFPCKVFNKLIVSLEPAFSHNIIRRYHIRHCGDTEVELAEKSARGARFVAYEGAGSDA